MINKDKSIQNEIIRMLQLSEFRNQKSNKIIVDKKIDKKILKEDFIDDLDDAFTFGGDYFPDGYKTDDGNKAILTDEMKAAMLCNNFTEMQAMLMGLYQHYNPDYINTTIPAKEKQDDTTFYTKRPSTKVRGTTAFDDLKRFKDSTRNASFRKEKDPNKITIPATFHDSTQDLENITAKKSASLKKWWGHKKDSSIISYDFKSRKLTDLGKEQLQFLARAATMKPEGDFESTLFDIFGTENGRDFLKTNAREILREFYTLVCIPYILELTHRTKYNSNDMQLEMFIENALQHMFSVLDTKYDAAKGSIGTFIISGVKNHVKNQLRDISEYKLDFEKTQERLFSQKDQITIKSTAKPNDVEGNYNSVDKISNFGTTRDGKKIYGYVYNNPSDALSDFKKDARKEGGKPSPLSRRFLEGTGELSKYYKSFPPGTFEDVKDGMNYQDVDPYKEFSVFKVNVLPQEAKSTIYKILNQITGDIIKKSEINKNKKSIIENNRSIFIELMYSLLNYGSMVGTYNHTWTIKGENGKPSVKAIGRPVKYEEINGQKVPVKNIKGESLPPNYITRIWSTGSISEDEVKQKFLKNFLEQLEKSASQSNNSEGRELINVFQQDYKDAYKIITAVMNGLKNYFGFQGKDIPALKKNRDTLNAIIANYENSLLAENKVRLIIKNKLLNIIK